MDITEQGVVTPWLILGAPCDARHTVRQSPFSRSLRMICSKAILHFSSRIECVFSPDTVMKNKFSTVLSYKSKAMEKFYKNGFNSVRSDSDCMCIVYVWACVCMHVCMCVIFLSLALNLMSRMRGNVHLKIIVERHICNVQKRPCHFIGIFMVLLIAFTSINITAESSSDPPTLNYLQNKGKHTLGCYRPAQSCWMTFLHRVSMWPQHMERRLGLLEVIPSLHSRARLGDPGFSAFREQDASLSPDTSGRFCFSSDFISGSHYGETQACISLGEEAEDPGCQGTKVTLRGKSSWLQMANTQLHLASYCIIISKGRQQSRNCAGSLGTRWNPEVSESHSSKALRYRFRTQC